MKTPTHTTTPDTELFSRAVGNKTKQFYNYLHTEFLSFCKDRIYPYKSSVLVQRHGQIKTLRYCILRGGGHECFCTGENANRPKYENVKKHHISGFTGFNVHLGFQS